LILRTQNSQLLIFFSAKMMWTLKYRLFSFEGTIIGHYATT